VLLCLQDNVALIAVLEMVEQQSGSKQLLCVANTHIHANPELNDVKLWQVHTLLKGLEKIANRWGVPWKGICSATHEVDLHCAASTVGGPT
jgi:mRNA deadenylase 3'-5' endonuclease subunit Ccr4